MIATAVGELWLILASVLLLCGHTHSWHTRYCTFCTFIGFLAVLFPEITPDGCLLKEPLEIAGKQL